MPRRLPLVVADLGLPNRTANALRRHDIETVEGLTGLNPREVSGLAGIGSAALAEILDALGAHGLALATDPYEAYVCARHDEPRGDSLLAGFWLCDECTDQFVGDALHGSSPEYAGEVVEGQCAHCNRDRAIRLRQWLLCPVCERVLRSIGRSLVAAKHLLEFWETRIQPTTPDLSLVELDQPRLRVRGSIGNAAKDVTADFVIQRDAEDLVGVELKTGKSRIGRGTGVGSAMSRFQLDISDCDDIERAGTESGYPVYVIHSQVIDRVSPPSVRYVAIEAWWATPFALAEAFLSRSQRQRESKEAAYFDTKAFRPLGDAIAHIQSGGLDQSVQLYRINGMPRLYRESDG